MALPPPVQEVPPATHGPRVLLAEDDAELRGVLAEALRDDGCEVIEAMDGTTALNYLKWSLNRETPLRAPDLVVSDLRMPGYSGLEVLSQVRSWDHRLPVVLITAYGDRPIHETAERLGAVAVLDKPFPLEHLRATVFGLTSRFPR